MILSLEKIMASDGLRICYFALKNDVFDEKPPEMRRRH